MVWALDGSKNDNVLQIDLVGDVAEVRSLLKTSRVTQIAV